MKRIFIIGLLACSLSACNNAEKEAQARAQQATIDSLKNEAYKKQVADSIAQAAQLQQQQVSYENAAAASGYHHTHHHSSGSGGGYASSSSAGSVQQQQAAPQKKGWSAKAKGAIIGAGAGAITGAMVDKRKGEGAIIGGILGAGAGLGTGAIIDKKQKDKQQQQQR